jgi:ectoine hydroxylase-related dioxygenase (phytanoyl-CoA dioxygenase family)
MSINNISPTLFTVLDLDNAKKHLDEEGYVVFKDILNNVERQDFLQLFLNDMKKVAPNFDMYNSDTWVIKNFPGMFGKGMCVFNGLGQSDFMWNLRTNSAIQNIYKNILESQELVTSFDGCSMFYSNKQQSKSWLHIDQNPKHKIKSFQSSYNYYPVTDKSSGFIVVPKSHKTYSPNVKNNKDWVMLSTDKEYNGQYDKEVVKLCIPSNCLTIWSSKLIHANTGMDKKYINTSIDRLTCYVTFLDKKERSDEILQKRIDGYLNGVTTSHWANKYEPKKYPFGFKKHHESKNLGIINPKLVNGLIPAERLKII